MIQAYRTNRRGFTIVELVVVLGIIAVLLGLLLPAIQSIRVLARETVCKNKLRQIGLAMEQVHGSKPLLPVWDWQLEKAGGWPVVVLPFMDPVYANHVVPNMDVNTIPDKYRLRPDIFTCPMAPELFFDGNSFGYVDRAHYTLVARNRKDWSIRDVDISLYQPWLVGIEQGPPGPFVGPHRGGYYSYHRRGNISYIPVEANAK